MNDKQKSILKSYLRGVLVASLPLIYVGSTDVKAYIAAIGAGVVAPALRAMDKKDPAFGKVADLVDVELDKLARASKKK